MSAPKVPIFDTKHFLEENKNGVHHVLYMVKNRDVI